jgi:hypothetical protein
LPRCDARYSRHNAAFLFVVTASAGSSYIGLQMLVLDGKRYGTGSVSDLSIDQEVS